MLISLMSSSPRDTHLCHTGIVFATKLLGMGCTFHKNVFETAIKLRNSGNCSGFQQWQHHAGGMGGLVPPNPKSRQKLLGKMA